MMCKTSEFGAKLDDSVIVYIFVHGNICICVNVTYVQNVRLYN